MRSRRIRAAFTAVVIGMLVYCATHLDLSTDVTRFLPEDSSSEVAALAAELAESPLARTMVLTIGSSDRKTTLEAAKALADDLRGHPEVAWVRSGVQADRVADLYPVYFPRRYRFFSDRPETEIPRRVTREALRERARELRRALALPTSTATDRLVAHDPLGAFEAVVERLRRHRPSQLETVDGQFVTRDGRFAVLFLETRPSAFDSLPQARLLRDLERSFTELRSEFSAELRIEASGANRFAVAAEQSVRRDIVLIVTVSSLGVAGVFLAFFRSLRFFWFAAIPPLAGILCGSTLTRLIFGDLDGVTMAFGACLIGVAIDYSIHVLNHYRLDAGDPRAVVRRLRPSIVVGGLTTMASFGGLALTSFPGFREIGCFATAGVGASLLVTLFVLPEYLGRHRFAAPPVLARRVSRGLGIATERLTSRPRRLALVPLGCAVAAAFFLPGLRFEDDLSTLMATDPELVAEQKRVRERVGGTEAGRGVFALGPDVETAVARNDRVALRLDAAQKEGLLEGFRSLHALLWSRSLQDRNLRELRSVPDLVERVESAFAAEGFRREAFRPFREAMEGEPPPPLDATTLSESALGDWVSSLLLDLRDRVAVVTYLDGVSSLEQLDAALADLDGVYVVDQQRFLEQVYREFRIATLRQIGVGSLLVVLVLALRYRRWRPVLAALLPSLLVAATVLAVFSAFHVGVHLLHVMSLVMVMGMGVDYGVFVVDSARRRESRDATMLSLLLSCLTTVFVFGTLAVSEHGALQAIGWTTGLGVLLAFAFAPITLLVSRGSDSESDR